MRTYSWFLLQAADSPIPIRLIQRHLIRLAE